MIVAQTDYANLGGGKAGGECSGAPETPLVMDAVGVHCASQENHEHISAEARIGRAVGGIASMTEPPLTLGCRAGKDEADNGSGVRNDID